jgi:hypothetical protein
MSGGGSKRRVSSQRDMPVPAETEVARRARAALGYADIEVKDGLKTTDGRKISSSTLARIVSATNPRGVLKAEELDVIADACGVPRRFMSDGFAPDDPTLAESVEALGHRLAALGDSLTARLDRLEAALPDGPDDLRDYINDTRRLKSLLLEDPDGDVLDATAAGTRDATDATPAPDRAPQTETRQSANESGG